MTRPVRALFAGLLLAWPAGSVLAHAFGSRYDLPLPLRYYQLAAGLAVLLSFVVLAFFMRQQPRETARGLLLGHVGSRLPRLGNAFGAVAYLFLVAAALFGSRNVLQNIAPTFVWVWVWVGVAFAAAIAGDVWKCISPFPAFGRWIGARRRLQLPDGLGRWPAVGGFLFFAWLELVSGFGEQPRMLGLLMCAYLAWMLAGMWLFGVSPWLRTADVFENVFGLFGRCGILELEDDAKAGRHGVRLRLPGAGLDAREPLPASQVVLVIALLATVSFDGLLETPAWLSVQAWIESSGGWRPLLLMVHGIGIDLLGFVKTVALLTMPAAFALAYALCIFLMRLTGGAEVSMARLFGGFAMTLVPIAVAYHLAHYLSYLVIAGQQLIPLLSDPFGVGWNLFATRDYFIRIGLIGPKAVWIFSAIAIVAGHVISVILAHRQAMRLYSSRRGAVLSQLPMIVLMVAYTMTSLWILSQPIVETG